MSTKPKKKKKNSDKPKSTINWPAFWRMVPDPIKEYLKEANISVPKKFSPSAAGLMIQDQALEAYPWQAPFTIERIARIAVNLSMLNHRRFSFGKHVLVCGVQAGLYAGFLVRLWPELLITVLTTDEEADRAALADLPKEETERIVFCTQQEAVQKQYDSLLTCDLGNLWLYGLPADHFCSVEQRAEMYRRMIEEKVQGLLALIKPEGTFAFLHQNVGSTAFFGWMKSILFSKEQLLTFDFSLIKEKAEFEDISVLCAWKLPQKLLNIRENVLDAMFRNEMINIRDGMIELCQSEPAAQIVCRKGAFARFALEVNQFPMIRGVELETKQDGITFKNRLMLFQDTTSMDGIVLGVWRIPDDDFMHKIYFYADPAAIMRGFDHMAELYKRESWVLSERDISGPFEE